MIVFVGKEQVRLDDRNVLGEGGEGRVYRHRDLALKIFAAPTPARAAKLRAFPSSMPAGVVAPVELCRDGQGAIIGYAMHALGGAADIAAFARRKWREGRVDEDRVLAVFRALAGIVADVHRAGIVVGDLNDGNVVVTAPAFDRPWLIDADSMQLPGHPCVVAHERTLDPRLYGVDLASRQGSLDRESDWYAFAVLLFASLVYVHPYGGTHPDHPTLLRRAEARCSVLASGVKLPGAVRVDVLSDDALAWFGGVFERGLRGPPPAPVLDARFTRCGCGVAHARPVCPACTTRVLVRPAIRTRGKLVATRVFLAPGRIVACTGAAYAWEDDDRLWREDGSVVLTRVTDPDYFRDPDRAVRLAGTTTWVRTAGRWTAHRSGGREVFPGAEGDAGPGGLVHVAGDVLVRAPGATRLGSVLEGQTHVRVGASLGFAFYRAGDLAVAFVFDPARGGLRQIEGFPPLRGRLAAWSAVFDDAHVLVTFALELAGHTTYVVHLVDRTGRIVASDRSTDPAATALARGTTGRALAGGSIVVATDAGLVLLRASAGVFVPVRLFAEAADLVSPEDELVPGPGGSLHVIAHDEITHLCFHP